MTEPNPDVTRYTLGSRTIDDAWLALVAENPALERGLPGVGRVAFVIGVSWIVARIHETSGGEDLGDLLDGIISDLERIQGTLHAERRAPGARTMTRLFGPMEPLRSPYTESSPVACARRPIPYHKGIPGRDTCPAATEQPPMSELFPMTLVNDPARAGQRAQRKTFFGPLHRYSVAAVHTRFDHLLWYVWDASIEDAITGGPEVVRMAYTREDAVRGLDGARDALSPTCPVCGVRLWETEVELERCYMHAEDPR